MVKKSPSAPARSGKLAASKGASETPRKPSEPRRPTHESEPRLPTQSSEARMHIEMLDAPREHKDQNTTSLRDDSRTGAEDSRTGAEDSRTGAESIEIVEPTPTESAGQRLRRLFSCEDSFWTGEERVRRPGGTYSTVKFERKALVIGYDEGEQHVMPIHDGRPAVNPYQVWHVLKKLSEKGGYRAVTREGSKPEIVKIKKGSTPPPEPNTDGYQVFMNVDLSKDGTLLGTLLLVPGDAVHECRRIAKVIDAICSHGGFDATRNYNLHQYMSMLRGQEKLKEMWENYKLAKKTRGRRQKQVEHCQLPADVVPLHHLRTGDEEYGRVVLCIPLSATINGEKPHKLHACALAHLARAARLEDSAAVFIDCPVREHGGTSPPCSGKVYIKEILFAAGLCRGAKCGCCQKLKKSA